MGGREDGDKELVAEGGNDFDWSSERSNLLVGNVRTATNGLEQLRRQRIEGANVELLERCGCH